MERISWHHQSPLSVYRTPGREEIFRNRFERVVGLSTLICLVFALCPAASAEESVEAVDGDRTLSTPSADAVDLSTVPFVAAMDAIDFWVISTRRCPQTGFCLCPPEQYEYFHRDSDHERWDASDLPEFLQSVTPTQPVCFFVHGNRISWCEAFSAGCHASEAIRATMPPGRRLTFVLCTWPSDRVSPLLTTDIKVKASRAQTTGFYLAQLIRGLPADERICLAGHSHGAMVVASALQLLGGGVVAGRVLRNNDDSTARRIRAVFLD